MFDGLQFFSVDVKFVSYKSKESGSFIELAPGQLGRQFKSNLRGEMMLDRGLSLLIFIVRYVGSFALGTVSIKGKNTC